MATKIKSGTPEYHKKYYEDHRDEKIAYSKEYRAKNKKRRADYQKKWREKNVEHIRVYNRKHYKEEGKSSKERRKRDSMIRGHRIKNGGELSIETVQKVYERNIKEFGSLKCIYCMKNIIFGDDSLEHKFPLCRGGKNNIENLAIACRRCNCRKHKRTESEYRTILKEKGAENE